jgi:EmrB/QacA subfamily drug resistance transporter
VTSTLPLDLTGPEGLHSPQAAQSTSGVAHAAQPTGGAADAPASAARKASVLGLITVFVTQLMLVVDASIVNVALPDIQRELHFTASGLSWVVTGYALAFAGLMLLTGKLGSMIGPKLALIIGTLVFIAASAAGGLADTASALVIARVIQGIGAAIAAPSTLVLLMANTTPGPQRNRAMSLFVLAAGSGGAIGLILGGVLTTSLGWEWVMFVNVPIGIVIALGAIFFLRETERTREHLDYGGAATSVIAMIALVYGFTEAATEGWGSPVVIVSFAVAAAALIALVLIERGHRSPVVPLQLFTRSRSAVPLVSMLLVPAGMFAFFYLITLFTQDVYHYDALGTGLALLPFVTVMIVVSQFAPRLLARFGEKLIGAVGLAGLVVGLGWLSRLDASEGYAAGILGPIIVMGFGAGLTFAPITGLIMAHAPEGHVGATSSVLQTMQQLGGSIGVAVLSTVFVSAAAVSGLAGGLTTAIVGGVVFVGIAFVLYAIWGSNAPAADPDAEPVVLH